MTPSNHERIQRLRQEFQQALQEDEPPPWATNGTEAAGPLTPDPPSQPQLPQDDGFIQSSRHYSSLPRQPRLDPSPASDSWDVPLTDPRFSSGPSPRNGYLGGSSFNARVLMETQELLRQEQRRREQEAHKSPDPSSSVLPVTPQAAPKGPYRQDVPPSPRQIAKLHLHSVDRGFYS